MFINALTFNVNTLKEVSDERLQELKSYFYETQIEMFGIQQMILKDIQSQKDWKDNKDFKNILNGLNGSSALKNKYLPMFGVAGDRKDYLNLWEACLKEKEKRQEERKYNEFSYSNEIKIWTVISIEEQYSSEEYSSRVWVTTSVIGVFTSEAEAEEAAANVLGETHIIRSHLNKSVTFDDPIERTYGHTE